MFLGRQEVLAEGEGSQYSLVLKHCFHEGDKCSHLLVVSLTQKNYNGWENVVPAGSWGNIWIFVRNENSHDSGDVI